MKSEISDANFKDTNNNNWYYIDASRNDSTNCGYNCVDNGNPNKELEPSPGCGLENCGRPNAK